VNKKKKKRKRKKGKKKKPVKEIGSWRLREGGSGKTIHDLGGA